MTQHNETFGRLLRGAINSIAAYEGKTAAVVEEELGAAIGLSGATIQRYTVVIDKQGNVAAIDQIKSAGEDAKRVAEVVQKLEKK